MERPMLWPSGGCGFLGWLSIVGALAGCGRIGFDPLGGGDGGVLPDAPRLKIPLQGCPALAPPPGRVVTMTPDQASTLPAAVAQLQPGDTLALADGTYPVPSTLRFDVPTVTLRSTSGNRDAVVLDGTGASGDVIFITASFVTIADLTIRNADGSALHVVPDFGDSSGVAFYNLHLQDVHLALIHLNPISGFYADAGLVGCSLLEQSNAGRDAVSPRCVGSAIEAEQVRDWRIYDNVVRGIWCAQAAVGALYFYEGSRDTILERNRIFDCSQGVGLGLSVDLAGRTYADDPCPGVSFVGHYGGIVRNNFVVVSDPRVFASTSGFIAGVAIENSCGPLVLHNSIWSDQVPQVASITWRFAGTTATVDNNVVSGMLVGRDGGNANVAGNLLGASSALFVDLAAGDLHLLPTATAAIDRGVVLPPGQCDDDIDLQPRDATPDIGADER
jgi:hypothetical protein